MLVAVAACGPMPINAPPGSPPPGGGPSSLASGGPSLQGQGAEANPFRATLGGQSLGAGTVQVFSLRGAQALLELRLPPEGDFTLPPAPTAGVHRVVAQGLRGQVAALAHWDGAHWRLLGSDAAGAKRRLLQAGPVGLDEVSTLTLASLGPRLLACVELLGQDGPLSPGELARMDGLLLRSAGPLGHALAQLPPARLGLVVASAFQGPQLRLSPQGAQELLAGQEALLEAWKAAAEELRRWGQEEAFRLGQPLPSDFLLPLSLGEGLLLDDPEAQDEAREAGDEEGSSPAPEASASPSPEASAAPSPEASLPPSPSPEPSGFYLGGQLGAPLHAGPALAVQGRLEAPTKPPLGLSLGGQLAAPRLPERNLSLGGRLDPPASAP